MLRSSTLVRQAVGITPGPTDISPVEPVPGQPTRYRLGMRVFLLGSSYAEQLDLASEAQEVASEHHLAGQAAG